MTCARHALIWIPFIIIITGAVTIVMLTQILPTQMAMRVACKKAGLPQDCNDDAVIDSISTLSLIISLVPGLLSLLSLPIIGTYSNRLGRRNLMTICLLGQAFLACGWWSLFAFDPILPQLHTWINHHWKVVIIVTATIGSILGSIPIVLYVMYSSIGDLSESNPDSRTIIFVSADLAILLMTILGLQSSSFMLERYSDHTTTSLIFYLALSLLPISFLFYPETVSPELRAAPIEKGTLTIIGPIKVIFSHCCGTSAQKRLNEDFTTIFNRLQHEYSQGTITINGQKVGVGGGSGRENEGQEEKMGLLPDPVTPFANALSDPNNSSFDIDTSILIAPDIDTLPMVLTGSVGGINSGKWSGEINNHSIGEGDHHNNHHHNNNVDQNVQHSTTNPHPSNNTTATILSTSNDNSNDQTLPLLLSLHSPPRFIPHKTAWLLLSATILLNVALDNSMSTAAYYYLKQQWGITPHQFSNVYTYATLSGVVVSFLLFPLISLLFNTSFRELILVSLIYCLELCLLAAMTFLKDYTLWVMCCVAAAVVVNIPCATMRALMINQVSPSLQPSILTVFSIVQSIALLSSGTGANAIWLLLQGGGGSGGDGDGRARHSNWVWMCFGLLAFVAALVPWLFNHDSIDDFNLRVEMVKVYTQLVQRDEENEREGDGVGEDGGNDNEKWKGTRKDHQNNDPPRLHKNGQHNNTTQTLLNNSQDGQQNFYNSL